MSDTVVTFEDGATAFLRDPRSVPNKLRNPVKNARMALAVLGVEFEDIEDEKARNRATVVAAAKHPDLMDNFHELLMLALTAQWSYEFEVTREGLGEIPGHAYDRLLVKCQELSTDMFADFSPTDDKDSPTLPSGT